MLDKLIIKLEQREKSAFYASDFGKSVLDIYYGFTGQEVTNPVKWYDTLKWGAGNGVEDSLLRVLKDSEIVRPDYNQKTHGRIDVEREGVTIHGYVDAINRKGEPIEIKSINNKNMWDIRAYSENNPKENYVGQLVIYMDALNMDTGHLIACTIDGLHQFYFEAKKTGERQYKCGNVTIDLDKEYKRWAKLYHGNIEPVKEPKPFQIKYKTPIEDIDWTKISSGNISKARTNKKVIGDDDQWKITYSPWKNLILEKQGVEAGYSMEEIEEIKKLTKNYTTWK